ncbi:MAG: hypothetical protein Q9195_005726 [Heterodermia aff. obscurata]
MASVKTPSTGIRNNLVLSEGATLTANQPSSSTTPGLHERVARAKADFADFLKKENISRHFLSVNSRQGPLRRKDGDHITSSNKWTIGRYGIIVIEDDIYDLMLSYQRVLPLASRSTLFHTISRSFEGIQWRDANKASQLWKKHDLVSLDMADDSLWGGERRAVIPEELTITPEDPDFAAISDSGSDSSTSSSELSQSADFSDGSQIVNKPSSPSVKLHPLKPNTIQVGFSEGNGKEVWLRFIGAPGKIRGENSRSTLNFYDCFNRKRTEENLQIQWHQDFRYQKFTNHGSDKMTGRQKQRLYIYKAMQKAIRHQRRNLSSHVIDRARPGTSVSATSPTEKRKRKDSPQTTTERRSSRKTILRRHRLSEPKNYYESDVETSSEQEYKPSGSPSTKPAVFGTRPSRIRNPHPENNSDDDLEMISVSTINPSSVRPQYATLETKPKIKSEFPPDPTNLPSHDDLEIISALPINPSSLHSQYATQETKPKFKSEFLPDPTTNLPSHDDLELMPALPINPSSLHSQYETQETKPKFKSEFPPDPTMSLPSHVINATSLLVSLSNQPDRAPANVPLSQCPTLPDFFQTLITERKLTTKLASKLDEVSAKYTWDGKRHLIRKARPRDWVIFVETVRKAWERNASRFEEDGCEVEMVVHVR